MKTEILFLAYNRLEFTQASFNLLRANTDWRRIDRLVVYDDGSTDGTAEWLEDNARDGTATYVEVRHIKFGSPPATMNDYLATTTADVFAKIDNDILLPEGWLASALNVMKRHPELELLGLNGGMTGVPDVPAPPRLCGYDPCSHIGGVGAMCVAAFHTRPSLMARGRHGFTQWQEHHEPVRGWITPGLAVAELDRIPAEPWRTLASGYVERGWAREWGEYSRLHPWWDPMLRQVQSLDLAAAR